MEIGIGYIFTKFDAMHYGTVFSKEMLYHSKCLQFRRFI